MPHKGSENRYLLVLSSFSSLPGLVMITHSSELVPHGLCETLYLYGPQDIFRMLA